MGRISDRQIDEAIANFRFEGTLIEQRPYGNGHINDTFLLVFEIAEMGRIKVILQRMNSTGRTYGECFRSDFLSAQKDYRERWRPGKRDFERNSHCSKQTIFCGFTGRLLESI